MKHLRIRETQQSPLLVSPWLHEKHRKPSLCSFSPVMVQLRRCEFISVAAWEWIEALLSCPVTHPPCRSPLASLSPCLSHLMDSSPVLLPSAVISCQLTGKRPIYEFNTRSWHLSYSCQAQPTCRQDEWWGNVTPLIFTRLNWSIYSNLSPLALHYINTACFLPCEQICELQT